MSSSSSLQEAARVAFASLSGSKLRSFLTLLGIILATTTLIVVMSVIHGMDVYIAKQVSDMGAEGFRVRRIVMIGRFDAKKYWEMEKKHPNMSREEYDFIRSRATMLRDVGLEAWEGVKVKHRGKTLDWTDCQGVSANMGAITNMQLTSGRYIAISDDLKRQPVAVVGNDIKEEFFPNSEAVGKSILVNGQTFEIIGVAKAKGSIFGESQDKFVLIPIESYFKMFGSRKGLGYNAVAIDQGHLQQAQEELRSLLRAYR
ncbi:MAG: ABC transporter permease, partial [Bryobacteraceae bacterium]|nr:ABC transporter permease [Bryobacteraceae bacterium]